MSNSSCYIFKVPYSAMQYAISFFRDFRLSSSAANFPTSLHTEKGNRTINKIDPRTKFERVRVSEGSTSSNYCVMRSLRRICDVSAVSTFRGSAVSLMSAASLWATLCWWAGTKRASIVMLLANHGKSTLQKILLYMYAIRLNCV